MDLLFPPEGLQTFPNFLTGEEEGRLIALFERLPWEEVRMHGVAARRQVVHYGLKYAFDSSRLDDAAQLPPLLHALRQRCAERAGIAADCFEETLVTRYPPGAGIGWHRDAPAFGPLIVGVSLGSDCTMRFRPAARPLAGSAGRPHSARLRAATRSSLPVLLPARSAYVLSGPARAQWQHGLPAVKSLRYSVTFRTLRGSGSDTKSEAR